MIVQLSRGQWTFKSRLRLSISRRRSRHSDSQIQRQLRVVDFTGSGWIQGCKATAHSLMEAMCPCWIIRLFSKWTLRMWTSVRSWRRGSSRRTISARLHLRGWSGSIQPQGLVKKPLTSLMGLEQQGTKRVGTNAVKQAWASKLLLLKPLIPQLVAPFSR